MHPLEKKTLKIVQQENLLQAGEKIVVGVSAGPDSMALLHVLARLSPALDITLAAVYVNHGLRPDEAKNENSVVEAEANRLEVAFFSGSVDVKEFAERQKYSPEHAARLLRYDFLEKTAREFGAHKIAVAHTADDQAEEILLRLIRGTARKGLSGMKTIRAEKFIRPFLKVPKSDLLEYLDKYSIQFLLDSSNVQHHFLRNRIRNELLPYLAEKYNPDIRQTLLRTVNILQDEEELLEKITAAAFTKTVTTIPQSPAQVQSGSTDSNHSCPKELQLSLELFNSTPRAIQRRILEKCCWLMACEPRSRQIEDILQLAAPSSPAGSLHLSDGLRVLKNREQLYFKYPKGRGPFRGNILHDTGVEFPETRIPGPGSYDFPLLDKRLVVEVITDCIPGSGDIFPTGEYLNSDLFSFPLILRGLKSGERFHPLGAPGSKKITDFLSDQKIEKHLRAQIPILCADDSVLALPGLRIDHRFRITESSTHAVRVRWEEMKREVKG
jgi:tRNA(Ile)-lysidine synthase